MINLLDVTLRDGGLANDFAFSPADAVEIVRQLGESGVECAEVGYYRPRETGALAGPRVCDLSYLQKLSNLRKRPRLAVMVHTPDVDTTHYRALKECDVSLVRFPVSRKNMHEIEAHLSAARSEGLAFTVNIIRVSELNPGTILNYGELAQRAGASALYIADSNGSLYPEQVMQIAGLLRARLSLPLGFHAHDNLTLAFANSLAALSGGVSFFDSSLGGLGKGGCNLMTELMAVYLNVKFGKSYDVFRLAQTTDQVVTRWLSDKFAERFDSSILGALDCNLDWIAGLRRQVKEQGASFRVLLEDHYRTIKRRQDAVQEAV